MKPVHIGEPPALPELPLAPPPPPPTPPLPAAASRTGSSERPPQAEAATATMIQERSVIRYECA
jgi:hypothetical protein